MASLQATVVTATMAKRERSSTLFRAINSLRHQETPCQILVVINGRQRDIDTVEALKRADDVRVLERSEGNLPRALEAGTQAVKTPYFCFLDDDDVLTPSAIRRRVDYMERHPEADAVVTAGHKVTPDGTIEKIPEQFDDRDPLRSLFECNWLASCGGMFRRSRIGPDYFARLPQYLEWTPLALRLMKECQVGFVMDDPEPYFTIFDTTGSESKTHTYVLALPENVAGMQDTSLPREIQHLLSDKAIRAAHSAATCSMENGWIGQAWRFHLASMNRFGGLRYLPFTRHLVRKSLGQYRRKFVLHGVFPRIGKAGINTAGRP